VAPSVEPGLRNGARHLQPCRDSARDTQPSQISAFHAAVSAQAVSASALAQTFSAGSRGRSTHTLQVANDATGAPPSTTTRSASAAASARSW
jgi:hypothetical protein